MTQQEFLNLIDKYLNGTATKAEQQLIDSFFDSYEKKDQQQKLPDVSDEMWASIQTKLNKPEKAKQAQYPTIKPSSQKTKQWVKMLSLSFSLVLLLGIGLFVAYQQGLLGNQKREWKTVAAPAGQKSVLNLADGSIVHLNSGSAISYPEEFAPDKREVVLEGEAFFEVAENPDKPFTVRSGNVNTTVLGTSFNIYAFPQEKISVTVASGKVEVKALADGGETTAGASGLSAILSPGEQAVYNPGQNSISTSAVDVKQYTAWRENIIRFDNATLKEVGEKLNRWYGVELAFENEKVQKCRISGQFKDQSLENVLESMAYMHNIKYKFIHNKKILLYGKGCE